MTDQEQELVELVVKLKGLGVELTSLEYGDLYLWQTDFGEYSQEIAHGYTPDQNYINVGTLERWMEQCYRRDIEHEIGFVNAIDEMVCYFNTNGIQASGATLLISLLNAILMTTEVKR